MDPRKLAKAYETEVMPHWEDQFVPFLLEVFPDELPAKSTLLEMGCASGRLTTEIAIRLPPGCHLIAVEDNPDLLEMGRNKIVWEDRKRVFFKQEPPDNLSFADGIFDGVLSGGFPPAFDLQTALREATRLLRPGAFLLMGVPLMGSFQELVDVFREVLEKEDLVPVLAELDRYCARMPDCLAANRLLIEVGLTECRVETRDYPIGFDTGIQLLESPLVRQHCLDDFLNLISDRGWRKGVVAGMIRALDTYFPDGIEMTIVLGRLQAIKPQSPIDDPTRDRSYRFLRLSSP
jgi:SAM-dependent methyltransferase